MKLHYKIFYSLATCTCMRGIIISLHIVSPVSYLTIQWVYTDTVPTTQPTPKQTSKANLGSALCLILKKVEIINATHHSTREVCLFHKKNMQHCVICPSSILIPCFHAKLLSLKTNPMFFYHMRHSQINSNLLIH